MKMQTMLNDEIQNQIEELGDMELGSEKYNNAVNGIAKLADKAIELEKISVDSDKQLDEKEFQEKKLAEEKKDRKWRNGLGIANLVVLGVGTYWAYRYEEKGTITTKIGNNFMGWFRPKK